MSIPSRQQGLTLLELVITISIAAILISGFAASWNVVVDKVAASQAQTGIRNAFGTARESAVYRRQVVTVCPLDANGNCVSDWNQPISVFLDPTNQKALSNPDNLIKVVSIHSRGTLRSSSVGGGNLRRYFQYNPDGSTRGSIGHLIWCPDNSKAEGAVQARLNFGGRIRWARDNDGDNVVEGSSGQPVTCNG